jgi:hypothetical protein
MHFSAASHDQTLRGKGLSLNRKFLPKMDIVCELKVPTVALLASATMGMTTEAVHFG